MKNKILIVVIGIIALLAVILLIKNCSSVKETQVIATNAEKKAIVQVLDSITNNQKYETNKKDSINAQLNSMSATDKRKRAVQIFNRRRKERLGSLEDEECRKLLDEERQPKRRRNHRRL